NQSSFSTSTLPTTLVITIKDLKQISTVQEYVSYFRNLLRLIEKMYKANKVIYFTEGLKGATKVEVNYWASEILDNVVKLAISYNTAMYESFETYKEQELTPMELDKTEIKNNKQKGFLRTNKNKILIKEQKQIYKKNSQYSVCSKKDIGQEIVKIR
ncbi:6818_t:CDS:2, partial [Dentiscutata heterogama]